MSMPLIWLHEEALRASHPVFKAAPADTRAVYVWDDGYFRQANYSLKRLIFIYEALCGLPINIAHGNTLDVLRQFSPSVLYIPATNNPMITEIMCRLNGITALAVIEDEPFTVISPPRDLRRFFHYWKKAEKSAFLHNGEADA
jgi:hypothetical protein